MRRVDWRFGLSVLFLVTSITLFFGGDYIKSALVSSDTVNQASAASLGADTTTAPIATAPASTAAPPATRAEPQRRDDESVTVYITDTGERYHRGSCHHLRRSKHPVSLASAKRQGYTPCKVCRPAR